MILETERLLLRPFYESDAEDVFAYAQDPRVGPVAGWPAHKSVEESRQVIRTVFAGPRRFCHDKEGHGKGHRLRRPGGPALWGPGPCRTTSSAMPWGADYWGQGLTTEAARTAAAPTGFTQLGLQTLWCGYYDGK